MYPSGDPLDSKNSNETITLKNIYIYTRKLQNKTGGMLPIFFNIYFVRRFLRHPVAPPCLPLAPVGPRDFFKHTNVYNHTGARFMHRGLPLPPVASRCPAWPPVASPDMLATGPDSVSRTNVGTVETQIGGKAFSPPVATRFRLCRPTPELASLPVA